jgi:hypothetical protein
LCIATVAYLMNYTIVTVVDLWYVQYWNKGEPIHRLFLHFQENYLSCGGRNGRTYSFHNYFFAKKNYFYKPFERKFCFVLLFVCLFVLSLCFCLFCFACLFVLACFVFYVFFSFFILFVCFACLFILACFVFYVFFSFFILFV